MTASSLDSPFVSTTPPAVNGDIQQRVLAVLEQYLIALEQGDAPAPEALIARHPDLATQLRDYLVSLDFLHKAALGLSGDRAALQTPDDGELLHSGTLGDYRILRELGRGGMGVVYEAEQISLGRRVALKVLPFAGTMDQKQLQRFKNESHNAASLDHPNIVRVHAVGSERGVHFYAMQLIEGMSLAELLDEFRRDRKAAPISPVRDLPTIDSGSVSPKSATRNPLADTGPFAAMTTEYTNNPKAYFRRIADLGIQASEALDYAHQMGIVHRDVKPANLMLDVRGNLALADFGLARTGNDANLTMTGDLLGTLRYMSPEQALAQRVTLDHRTDVYSLGVTLYELLTGRPAFDGKDRAEVLNQIAFDEPKKPRSINKCIPAELETIVLKAMEKEAGRRYDTAKTMADDLRRWMAGRPIQARRPGIIDHTSRWARKHIGKVAAAVIALTIALAGALTAMAFVASERDAKQDALDGKTIALDEKAVALQHAREQAKRAERNFVVSLRVLRESIPFRAIDDRTADQTKSAYWKEMETVCRSVLDLKRDEPGSRFEIAVSAALLARISWNRREPDAVVEALTIGCESMHQLMRESPNDPIYIDAFKDFQQEVLKFMGLCLNEALETHGRGDSRKAEEIYRRAAHLADLFITELRDPDFHNLIIKATVYFEFGRVLRKNGKPAEALSALEKALADWQRQSTEAAFRNLALENIAWNRLLIGEIHEAAGDRAKALESIRKGIEALGEAKDGRIYKPSVIEDPLNSALKRLEGMKAD